jgi:uncharacterized protein (TIGR02996 family)
MEPDPYTKQQYDSYLPFLGPHTHPTDHPEQFAHPSRPVRFSATDIEPLIAGVHAAPEDIAPKLVLADALEETGHSGAADVIRRATGHKKTQRAVFNPWPEITQPTFVMANGPLKLNLLPVSTSSAAPHISRMVKPVVTGNSGRKVSVHSPRRTGNPLYRGLGLKIGATSSKVIGEQIATHYTHDPELIRRILTEFGSPKYGHIVAYRRLLRWLEPVIGGAGELVPPRYGRVETPEQMQRSGGVVRMSREHILPTFEYVKANPHDDQGWLELADLLHENGKPIAAELMRKFGRSELREELVRRQPHSYRHFDDAHDDKESVSRRSLMTPVAQRSHGHILGIPIAISPYNTWSILYLPHLLPNHGNWSSDAGLAYITNDHAHQLLSEFDESPEKFERDGAVVPKTMPRFTELYSPIWTT